MLMQPSKDTVSKQSEDYEVDGRPHAVLHASLGPDPVVHHLIPVLTGQNLQTNTQPQSTTGQIFNHNHNCVTCCSVLSLKHDTSTYFGCVYFARNMHKEDMVY